MTRSRSTEAIVLKNSRIGDIHKGVVLFTPDDGLLRAIAHGAYSQKGKLRGTTNLFCRGTCYLYTEPVKKSTKITDFDVVEYHSGIREDLVRFYTASLWAEALLKTYAGGGESQELYALLVESLGLLQARPPADAERISIHFVWRFLGASGMQPDLEHCAASGDFFAEDEPVYYSAREQGFVSAGYADEQSPRWQPGAVAYLRYTGTLPPARAIDVIPPDGAVARVKRVLYEILEEHVEAPLNALRSGSGIL